VTSSCETSRETFHALALERLERAQHLELSDDWIITMMGRLGGLEGFWGCREGWLTTNERIDFKAVGLIEQYGGLW